MQTTIYALFYSPDSEIYISPSVVPLVASTSSKPTRLLIPSLHIDAYVQSVGVTKKNEMGTPNNFTDVAWYKYGPTPGQMGSAVIDGHVDNGLALAGVFKRLNEAKVGDDVYIIAQDGSKLHFMVIDIKSYPYSDAPTDLIFAQSDTARLNLITCSGTWVAGKRTYSERTVVYTTFVDFMKADGV